MADIDTNERGLEVEENGNYVSRAELAAHLGPMRRDIGEIKTDVKTLLEVRAGQRAVARERKRFSDRWLALSALVVSAAATLVGWFH